MNIHKNISLNSIIRVHLYSLIVLLPLVFCLNTATVFAMPKLIVFRIITISAIFFMVLKIYVERKLNFVWRNGYVFPIFWFFSLILSTLFSINQLTSVFGQYGRFMGLLTFVNLLVAPMILIHFFPKEKLRNLLVLSVIIGFLVAMYGILQYFEFFGLLPWEINWTDSPKNRVFSSIGHANHLGAYLAANLIFLKYLFSGYAGRHRLRTLAATLFAAITLFICLLLTASRGAIISFFLVYVLLSILKTAKNHAFSNKKLYFSLFAGFFATILLLIGVYIGMNKLTSLGVFTRTEHSISSIEKGFIPERLSFLQSAWQMFLDRPLTGTGLSTFRDAYSAYRRTDYVIDGPGNAHQITVPEAAHNEYANMLATQGILGFVSFIGLICYAIVTLSRRYFRNKTERDNLYIAILGGVLVFAIQIIFNFAELVNWFLFFLLFGMVLTDTDSDKKISIQLHRIVGGAISIITIIILYFSVKWNVLSPILTDFYLNQANIAEINGETEIADGFYRVAIGSGLPEYQLYQKYGDFLLGNVSTLSEINEKERNLLLAAQNYRKAIFLNPNYPSTYHNLALSYLYLYKIGGNEEFKNLSKEAYQKSIEKSPNNPRYIYEYARKLHSDWNNPSESIRLLRQAKHLDPNYQEVTDYMNFLFKNHPELNTVE